MVADGESGGGFYGEPVVFDAALDVLGDWGSDSDWLARLPPSPPSPTTPSNACKQDGKSDPKRTDSRTDYRRKRDARDAKRLALESQVAQLTETLELEKMRFPTRSQPLTGDALALSREWASMARRQKRQRFSAESDHAKLQEAYEVQSKIGKQLERLLSKALAIGRSLGPTSETVTIANYCGPTLDAVTHIAYLESLCAHANSVTSTGVFFEKRGHEFRNVRFHSDGIVGIQVEFIADWVLPFGVASVADAVWNQITQMKHDGRRVAHEHIIASPTVLVSSFVSAPDTAEMPGSNHNQIIAGTTHGQTALRCFDPADDGSVWILGMNHGRIVDEDGLSKGHIKSDGWICVTPEKVGGPPSGCRIKWCHRVSSRPQGYEAVSRDERARWMHSAVTKPMRRHWERTFAMTIQAVENALVLGGTKQDCGPTVSDHETKSFA